MLLRHMRCSFLAMDMLSTGSRRGPVWLRRLRAQRTYGDAELAQSAHVVTDQPLPFALVGCGLVRFPVRGSRFERLVNDHCQIVGDGDQSRLAPFYAQPAEPLLQMAVLLRGGCPGALHQ